MLTTFELVMYVLTQIAIVLWAGSFLLLRFGLLIGFHIMPGALLEDR